MSNRGAQAQRFLLLFSKRSAFIPQGARMSQKSNADVIVPPDSGC